MQTIDRKDPNILQLEDSQRKKKDQGKKFAFEKIVVMITFMLSIQLYVYLCVHLDLDLHLSLDSYLY